MIDHEDRQVVTVPRWAMLECGGDARDAMVLAQVTWWFQPSQRDGSPRTQHLTERDGESWMFVTDAELADDLGMSRSQVQRARAALVRRGLLASKSAKVEGSKVTLIRPTVPADAGLRESALSESPTLDPCATPRNGGLREGAQSRARALPLVEPREADREPLAAGAAEDLFGGVVPEPTEAERLKALARVVTTEVFERRRPKPTQTWVAVAATAKRFLAAGHDPKKLTDAMIEPGPMTDAGVEFRIARAAERAPASMVRRGERPEDHAGPISRDEIRRIAAGG